MNHESQEVGGTSRNESKLQDTSRTVLSKQTVEIKKPPLEHPTKWKDLEKLITLLQTQTEDDGYFIYLKPGGDDSDPYDLQPLVDSSLV